jgi:hypothetical protein
VLTHTISVALQSTMLVNILNQCSDFELTEPGYFSNGAILHNYSTQEMDATSMKSVEFIPFLTVFEGGIICKLRRKHVKSDDQSELMSTLLLMGWKSEGYKKLHAFVQLIECDETFRWQNFELKEYYQKYASQLCAYTGPIKDTWLIYDGTVLITGLELDFTQRDGVLNITISDEAKDGEGEEKSSERVEDDHTKRLAWLSPRR